MKQGRAETKNVAAKIFGLVVETLGRDIIGGAPDFVLRIRILLGGNRQPEVANLRVTFVSEKNVRRLNVAMNESFFLRRPQAVRDLNPNLEDLRFRQLAMLGEEVVETAVSDQLHHNIELAMIVPRRENLHNIGMIDRCRETRFLLQARRFAGLCAQFAPQNFQRHQTIEPRIARLVN